MAAKKSPPPAAAVKDKPAPVKDKPASNVPARWASTAVAQAAPVDFEAYAGAGHEEARGAEDFAIPFISILQGLSPQVQRGKPEFIKGAEVSDIFDSVSNELWKTGGEDERRLRVVPCYYQRQLVEFRRREDGGGLVAIHPADTYIETERDDRNRDITDRGTQIVNTMQFYVLYESQDGSWKPAVMNFTSTKLKKAKRWNKLIQDQRLPSGKPAPMFANVYAFWTAEETNNEGTWFNYAFQIDEKLKPTDPVVSQALEFYKQVRGGQVRVSVEESITGGYDGGEGDDEGEAIS